MLQNEGIGWRLAWDPSRNDFPVLIGGEGWAVELTQNEWIAFYQIVHDLVDQHKQLKEQLLPQEHLSLELERHPWWGCLDGDRDFWGLQLILIEKGRSIRGLEVSWPRSSAKAFTDEMRKMWDSLH